MRIVHTEIKDSPPFSAPEAMLLIVCYFPQGERWFLRWGDPQVIFGTISPLVYELQMQMHQNSRWRYRGICFPFSSWNGWLVMWLENKNVDLSYCYISQELFRFCCLIIFKSLLSDGITDSTDVYRTDTHPDCTFPLNFLFLISGCTITFQLQELILCKGG